MWLGGALLQAPDVQVLYCTKTTRGFSAGPIGGRTYMYIHVYIGTCCNTTRIAPLRRNLHTPKQVCIKQVQPVSTLNTLGWPWERGGGGGRSKGTAAEPIWPGQSSERQGATTYPSKARTEQKLNEEG